MATIPRHKGMSKIEFWPTTHHDTYKSSSSNAKSNGFKIGNDRPMVEEKTNDKDNTVDQFKSILYNIFNHFWWIRWIKNTRSTMFPRKSALGTWTRVKLRWDSCLMPRRKVERPYLKKWKDLITSINKKSIVSELK